MANLLYMSYDGDGCGKKVGRAIIANDEAKLHDISAKIDLGHEIVKHWVAENGGKVISGGGDEGSFKVPQDSIGHIEQLRKDHEFATGITISIGVGSSLSEAGKSLLAAKFRGKNQVAYYNSDVEKDIDNARKRVKKGKASQEEYKLAEAYLKKAEGKDMAEKTDEKVPAEKPEEKEESCQYCDESDGTDPDHCKYCHDTEVAEGEKECPYCAENAQENECPYCKEAAAGTDCPYCKQDGHAAEQTAHGKSPDSTNATAPAGSKEEKEQANVMGMNPPVQGKPEMGNNFSPSGIGEANPGSSGAALQPPGLPGEGVPNEKEGIPQEGAHSKKDLQAIAQAIEGQTPEGKPEEKAVAQNVDDANIIGSKTDDNISRPEDYGSNKPGDMGLGGGSQHPDEGADNTPDLSSVLEEGLEDGADSMQRDKVVQMCSQALEGFKGCRDIIEQSKAQSPQLYQSSIMMLKAMIEMAKLLGLGEQGAVGSEGPIGAQGEEVVNELSGGNEWHDPFPKHPDKGGERKPGHAAGQEAAAQPPQR